CTLDGIHNGKEVEFNKNYDGKHQTVNMIKREEIAQILEYIHLSDMVVLFLEPRKIDGFAQYILDEDYFLITESNN
ncbi:hypothetical protein LGW15_03660, partial [Streptococcus mutans]|nr:hypothetical protein [Streptococcus mutans]